jgi:negative regulator of flagellin synthesis FlgM
VVLFSLTAFWNDRHEFSIIFAVCSKVSPWTAVIEVRTLEGTIMKIDQSAPFMKTLVDASPAVSAKEGAQHPVAPSRMTALSEQAPAPPAASALPSTQGDFDVARVTRIRDDISAGLYQVNTEKIADGLLASVRDLIGRKLS